MNTTDLFVEIIIIGMGAIVWLTLITLTIFGFAWVDPTITMLLSMSSETFPALIALIPFLVLAYVLGIVVDRFADLLFDRIKPAIMKKYYPDGKDYNDRRYLYERSNVLVEQLLYGRSRLRICRGWAFNTLLILICFNVLINRELPNELWSDFFIFTNVALFILICGLSYSWYDLTRADYRKIYQQSRWLRYLHRTERRF